tara:strand:- start:1388 stop:1528 length:141 start_codon:yes stop_codon:yes gene_type:complete
MCGGGECGGNNPNCDEDNPRCGCYTGHVMDEGELIDKAYSDYKEGL